MNMAGVVPGPKLATLAPAAASPALMLALISGEVRRGSLPTLTRTPLTGRPFLAATHSAKACAAGIAGCEGWAAVEAGLRSCGLAWLLLCSAPAAGSVKARPRSCHPHEHARTTTTPQAPSTHLPDE